MGWIWWVAGGVVLLGLVILALVALGTLRRLPRLRRVLAEAKAQAAGGLDPRGQAEMQESLAALRDRLEVTQDRLATIKESRGGGRPA
jgi:hypothetical protein